METRSSTCCFSGHRVMPAHQLQQMEADLYETIFALVRRGYRYFVAGGALGFDTLAAQVVLDLRDREKLLIQLIVVAPFEGQNDKWSAAQRIAYERIRNSCDDYICVGIGYHRGCYHLRNRTMVDMSSHCVAYCSDQKSGTAYTVEYAQQQGLALTNLATKRNQ